MSVLSLLGATFNPQKCIQSAHASIMITETHRHASLKSVRIVCTGTQALALKFDKCGFPGDKVFIVQHEMHRACDAIIFCQFKGEGYILCCELKSSEPKCHEAEVQLRSAHCFIDYLDSILQHCHNLSLQDWNRRYFLFHDIGNAGKSPLIEPKPINDCPERAMFYPVQNGESIYLRKLLGKPQ